MKWKKATIDVSRDLEETVENILIGCDIYSYEVENGDIYGDNVTGEFYDELQPDEDRVNGSTISFYMDTDSDETDIETLRDALKEGLGFDPLEISIVDDADWKDKWKEFFHAFTLSGIHIRPTWEETEDPDADIDIRIDPGMAFGTGKHESTYMILEHMREYLKPGDHVLDVGCGSGILSIAAAKLNAGKISGTDIDEDSVRCAYENMELNGVSTGEGEFLAGDITTDDKLMDRLGRGGYPIVFANILADIIMGMADKLYELTAENGLLVTSGIIDFKEDEVIDRVTKSGFKVKERYAMGEWRSVIFEK
ncbi:MAG: 50S ribosomal protein L11 methyltransferase [Lachnospiraceae bacterium]|nr:50S ribosomal protein L11 methyltransferase [Lachnospiraceae bacterium]